MEAFLNSNDFIKEMFMRTGISMEESFTAIISQVVLTMATLPSLAIISRLFKEEKCGRLNQIFSTKVKRSTLYCSYITQALIINILGMFFSMTSLGQTALSVMESSNMEFLDFFKIGFSQLPIFFIYIGIAGLILGLFPNFMKLVYIYQSTLSLLITLNNY